MSYYDDLSGGSSEENSSSEEEDMESDDIDLDHHNEETNLWSRSILHLDIDCFYCQCEEIDRNLRDIKPLRPLAIGQKHIIVTCNYEARKYGVKKLQGRENAMAACPDLWIVEGSDLQHYRRHSRAVYEAFRLAIQEIASELYSSSSSSLPPPKVPVRKGTMDEMMADVTAAVEIMIAKNEQHEGMRNPNAINQDQVLYIFGDSALTSAAVLVEDQTGQEALVSFDNNNSSNNDSNGLAESRKNIHEAHGTEQDQQACRTRLFVASQLAARICQRILDATGFHTTVGISVSPLLAKLASGLNKPKSVNLLYPWRSSRLMYYMPLRKMHNVGHRTMRALEGNMPSSSSSPSGGKKDMKTVR
jgi:DNA polymerase iota